MKVYAFLHCTPYGKEIKSIFAEPQDAFNMFLSMGEDEKEIYVIEEHEVIE